eukprot:TRINITY_DN65085_c0_g1_i1.p2 TRINITY_DN65085_c0_g1~~TRINITY_DN65085_c0_g1_i1.p2  ORF type:complete len:655 (+),score=271.21 TRINITY_DN65085_c0_g1_i1:121-1965(+)
MQQPGFGGVPGTFGSFGAPPGPPPPNATPGAPPGAPPGPPPLPVPPPPPMAIAALPPNPPPMQTGYNAGVGFGGPPQMGWAGQPPVSSARPIGATAQNWGGGAPGMGGAPQQLGFKPYGGAPPPAGGGPGGAVVLSQTGQLQPAPPPPAPSARERPRTYSVQDLKAENEVLKDYNDLIDAECDRLQLANDVLRAKVRQRDRELNQVHQAALEDLNFCKAFIEHERRKAQEEQEAGQRALAEEQKRLLAEQELQIRINAMSPEERASYEAEQARIKEAEDKARAKEEAEKKKQDELQKEIKRAHETKIRHWCVKNLINNETIIQKMIALDPETAMEVMRGNLVNVQGDRDAVVIARIRKAAPNWDAEQKKAEKAEKEKAKEKLGPGVISEDPLRSNDALLRFYTSVMTLGLPMVDHKYENCLTKSTMVLIDPNGEEVTCQVRVPGKNPDRLMIRELICGEMMSMLFPGKSREDIVCELERMKQMREILKREKLRKPDRPGATAGLIQQGTAGQKLTITMAGTVGTVNQATPGAVGMGTVGTGMKLGGLQQTIGQAPPGMKMGLSGSLLAAKPSAAVASSATRFAEGTRPSALSADRIKDPGKAARTLAALQGRST